MHLPVHKHQFLIDILNIAKNYCPERTSIFMITQRFPQSIESTHLGEDPLTNV